MILAVLRYYTLGYPGGTGACIGGSGRAAPAGTWTIGQVAEAWH